MSHSTAIILFVCGILSLIGCGLMTWFLVFYFRRKEQLKTVEFGSEKPNSSFIMVFWANVGLIIIPFALFVLGIILVGITIQPIFL